jgi:hypothetical protein
MWVQSVLRVQSGFGLDQASKNRSDPDPFRSRSKTGSGSIHKPIQKYLLLNIPDPARSWGFDRIRIHKHWLQGSIPFNMNFALLTSIFLLYYPLFSLFSHFSFSSSKYYFLPQVTSFDIPPSSGGWGIFFPIFTLLSGKVRIVTMLKKIPGNIS